MNFDETATEVSEWTKEELQDIYEHILDTANNNLPQVAFDRIDMITNDENVVSLFEGLLNIGDLPEEVRPMVTSRTGIEFGEEGDAPDVEQILEEVLNLEPTSPEPT